MPHFKTEAQRQFAVKTPLGLSNPVASDFMVDAPANGGLDWVHLCGLTGQFFPPKMKGSALPGFATRKGARMYAGAFP